MVKLPSQPLADIDPEFQKMALETGGLIYEELQHTSPREKLLQNFANDVCRGHRGLALKLHVHAAVLMHGVSYADLLAAIRFLAPYSGYPAAAETLGRVAELAVELDLDTTVVSAPDKDPVVGGRAGQPGVGLETSDDWMAGFLTSRIGRSWSEDRLSHRERVFMALTTDLSQQTLGESFRKHVQLGLDLDIKPDDIRDAVRFGAELGAVKAIAALSALDAVLDGR